MSVRLDRWFGVPPELIEGEFFAKMTPSDLALCIVLYWWSDRKTSRSFEIKVVEMEGRTKLSRRSLLDARKHLAALRIVVYSKTPGGHVYTLCNLTTGLPYPGDPRAKIARNANGAAGKIEPNVTQTVTTNSRVSAISLALNPSWIERRPVDAFEIPSKKSVARQRETREGSVDYGFDAAFNFGHNRKINERENPMTDFSDDDF
jgi:hypothetical protein